MRFNQLCWLILDEDLAGREEDLHEAFVAEMEADQAFQARLDAEDAHNSGEAVAIYPWSSHAT